jgi:hypothetical protein
MEFIMAHKITPTEAEPGDMQPRAGQRYQQGTAPLPAFLQSLSDSMTQRTSSQTGGLQNSEQQRTTWAYQNRNTRKNQTQSKAAMIGVIIWVLFLLISMLTSILGR